MSAAAKEFEIPFLPPQISGAILEGAWQRVDHGSNPGRVYRVRDTAGATQYLKIHPHDPHVSLKRERAIIAWLAPHVRVPRVIAYDAFDGVEYLLLSEVLGRTLIDASIDPDSMLVAQVLAKALRTLHSIDITRCPFMRRLDTLSPQAAGEVDPAAIVRWSGDEDLVFTHGDACLPNILIDDAGEIGFIDLARGGVSDRYLDLACAVHTLRYNEHPAEAVAAFFKAYDLPAIDVAKFEFYTLLNKLI